jgi:putative transposase
MGGKRQEDGELPAAFPMFQTLEKLISKQFSNLFSAYTQALNKQQKRMGSLFMKNYNRIQVKDQQYLFNVVKYIHHNPIESGLAKDLTGWKYSSFNEIMADNFTFLNPEIIQWFDDKDNFYQFHTDN